MMSRRRGDTRLVFETLEKRTMLAGDVAVQIVDGNLIVTGDDFDNEVYINRTDNVGEFVVTGSTPYEGEPTLINGKVQGSLGGATSYFSGVTGDLRIDLKGGDNRLTLAGGLAYGQVGLLGSSGGEVRMPVYDTPLVIPDDLVIAAGGGDNTLSLLYLDVGDDVRVTTGSGNDVVSLHHVRAEDNVAVRTGGGDDEVWIRNVEADDLTVKTYAGEDSLTILGTTTRGDLFVRMGSGANQLTLQESQIGGNARLYTSVGGDEVLIEAVLVANRLKLKTGGGADVIAIANTHTGDDLLVDTGAGDDLICVLGSSAGDDVKLRLDSGDDTALIGGLEVADRFALYGGAGDDFVNISSQAVDALLASDQDPFEFQNGSVEVGKLRTLLDHVVVEDAAFGVHARKTIVNTAGGSDRVLIADSSFDRKLIVTLGNGDDTLNFFSNRGRRAILNGERGQNLYLVILPSDNQFEFDPVFKNLHIIVDPTPRPS